MLTFYFLCVLNSFIQPFYPSIVVWAPTQFVLFAEAIRPVRTTPTTDGASADTYGSVDIQHRTWAASDTQILETFARILVPSEETLQNVSMSRILISDCTFVNNNINIIGAVDEITATLAPYDDKPLVEIVLANNVWTHTKSGVTFMVSIEAFFPKGVKIIITNCSFASQLNSQLTSIRLNPIYLLMAGSLQIVNNSFYFNETREGSVLFSSQGIFSKPALSSNATMVIANNLFSLRFLFQELVRAVVCERSNVTAMVFFAVFYDQMVMTEPGSSIVIEGNTLSTNVSGSHQGVSVFFIAAPTGPVELVGATLTVTRNVIISTVQTSELFFQMLLHFNADTKLSQRSSVVVDFNTIAIESTPLVSAFVLGATSHPLTLDDGSSLAIRRTNFTVRILEGFCESSTFKVSSVQVFHWLSTRIILTGISSVQVNYNSVYCPPPLNPSAAHIVTSQVNLLQFAGCNISQTDYSSVTVIGNSVSAWHSQYAVMAGYPAYQGIWVAALSYITIQDNRFQYYSIDGATTAEVILFQISASDNFRTAFISSNMSICDNTIEMKGSTSTTMYIFAVQINSVNAFIVNGGSVLEAAGNNLSLVASSSMSTVNAVVYIKAGLAALSSFDYGMYTSELIVASTDPARLYSIIGDVPSSMSGPPMPSSIIIKGNTVMCFWDKTVVDNAYLVSVPDGLTMLGITTSPTFLISNGSLTIQNNTVIAAGVAGAVYANSPTLFGYTYSNVIIGNHSVLLVKGNHIDTTGSSSPARLPLISKFPPQMGSSYLAVMSLMEGSSLTFRDNTIHGNVVQLAFGSWPLEDEYQYTGASLCVATLSGEGTIALEGNKFFISYFERDYKAGTFDQYDLSSYQLVKGLSVSMITFEGSFVVEAGSIAVTHNALDAIAGRITGSQLIMPSVINATTMEIVACWNSVNGEGKLINEERASVNKFRALLGPNSTLVFKSCGEDKTLSQTVSLSRSAIHKPTFSELSATSSQLPTSSATNIQSGSTTGNLSLTGDFVTTASDVIGKTPTISRRTKSGSLSTSLQCRPALVCAGISIANASSLCESMASSQPMYIDLGTYLASDEAAVRARHPNLVSNASNIRYGTIRLVSNFRRPGMTVLTSSVSSPMQLLGTFTLDGMVITIDVAVPTTMIPSGAAAAATLPYKVNISLRIDCRVLLSESNGAMSIHTLDSYLALEAPLWFEPKPVSTSETIAAGTSTAAGVVSVVGGGIVVPASAMQQGVALALMRMADCEKDSLDGEPLDVLVHPLRFGIGGGVARFARGAVVSNLILLPLLWAALAFLPIPWAVASLLDRPLATARDSCGWPSSLLVPFAVLGEGSAMASVALLSRDSPGDAVLGAFGIILLLASLVGWVWLMRVRLPPAQMKLVFMPRVGVLQRITYTRWEWAIAGKGDTEGAHDLDSPVLLRHNHCYGEFWWLWSAVCGYGFSLLVGVAEGMPNDTDALCRLRWVLACVGAVLQSLAVLSCTIPLQLVLLGATGALICVLVSLVAISTFSGGSSVSNSDAINTVGTLNALIGIALMVFGVGRLGYEFLRGRAHHRRPRHDSSTSAEFNSLFTTSASLEADLLSQSGVPDVQTRDASEIAPALDIQMHEMSYQAVDGQLNSRTVKSVRPNTGLYAHLPPAWSSILDEADEVALAATKSKSTFSFVPSDDL